jgi:hypothetical protein
VTASKGEARVAATALSTDQNGDARAFALLPTVGSAVPSVNLTTPVINAPPPSGSPRRRVVRK